MSILSQLNSVPTVSYTHLPNPLAPKGSNVSLVGDCDGVGNLRSVVWRAYEVAMKI